MWPAAGGVDERIGVVKLRFSKAELAAAAAELARDDGGGAFAGFSDGSDGGEQPLPAAADDDDGFDFDRRGAQRPWQDPAHVAAARFSRAGALLTRRGLSDEDEVASPPQPREPEPAQELIVRHRLAPRACCGAALTRCRVTAAAQDHAVWAKLRGFPAWPAQVLSSHVGHQAPPRPKPQCVLVHFFGTYDIQWLDNDKKARGQGRSRGAGAQR